ncbi:hypothetical protein CBS101457_003637 [Exobasidium rhododendri]|nr:hypothetical protein CBS101457_003637 [Exobasidium rhododendri]
MNDVTLDYGDPSEADMQRERENGVEMRDEEEMDAEMQDWANQYQGDEADFEGEKMRKLLELKQGISGTRFYPLPREEGVSAGANRGVSSLGEVETLDHLGPEDDSPLPETPAAIGGGQDIRYSVLHLSGTPVSQCSTSRLFAYITHYGAQPLGLEWIDDSSCNVVFSDSSAARLAIEYLCPAVSTSYSPLIPLPNDQVLDEAVNRKKRLDDPTNQEQDNEEWSPIFVQGLLTNRKAYRIPAKLYTAPEKDAAAEARRAHDVGREDAQSDLPLDVPEIYREMEAEDRKNEMGKPEQVKLQKLRGCMWVRWALESMDVKPSKSAKQSKWYQEHGNDAGKEVVTKLLNVGGIDDRLELLPSNVKSRRADKSKWDDSADTGRGRGNRQAAMDDLDADLDIWRGAENEVMPLSRPSQHRSLPDGRRGGRAERRGRMTMDALDEELDSNRRERSASPVRARANYDKGYPRENGKGGSAVKVKGRGRMKAPSAWDDANNGSRGSPYEQRWGTKGGEDNRRQTQNINQSLEQRMSQSLSERMRGAGGNDLLDRLG